MASETTYRPIPEFTTVAAPRAIERRLALLTIIILWASLPALIGIAAWKTDLGRIGTRPGSVDWVSHLTLIKVLADGQDLKQSVDRIGGLSIYPNWAHRGAALLGNTFHVSELQSYQLFASAATA